MRKVVIGLVVGAFALAIGGQASATPQFDAVITAINGNPTGGVATVTVAPSDIIRVELQLTIQSGDAVQSASMPMLFDNTGLTIVGPLAGPTTFHQPCSFGGNPCTLIGGAAANSGAATPDSQASGVVGAMGATSFGGNLAVGTAALGVVDFHVGNGGPVGAFVQFPGVDGTFTNFGATAVPFTVGPGAIVNIPEPTTALLIGLGLVGIAAGGRRR